MFIILEGADGSGKTRLQAELAQRIYAKNPDAIINLKHAGVPQRHPLDEYEISVLGYRPNVRLDGQQYHIITDRWHWGEFVYPELRSRPTKLDGANWWHINATLRARGAIIVLCSAYTDTHRRVFTERGESHDQLLELPEVSKRFLELVVLSDIPVITYNWESPINGDAAQILELARHTQRDTAHLAKFTTYVGPPLPRYLLLGDVRHGVDPRSAEAGDSIEPAFVPRPNTSGHYLLSALTTHWGPITLGQLGIANACDVDDPYELWEALGRPVTVTLGRHAARKFKHGQRVTIPHPQFIRRFHHASAAEYAHNILTALVSASALPDHSSLPTLAPKIHAEAQA